MSLNRITELRSHFVSEFDSWMSQFFRKWYNVPGSRLFFLNGKLTYKLRTALRYSLSLTLRRTLRYSVNLTYELRKSRLTEFVSEIYGMPLTELFVRLSYGVVYGVARAGLRSCFVADYGVVYGIFLRTCKWRLFTYEDVYETSLFGSTVYIFFFERRLEFNI